MKKLFILALLAFVFTVSSFAQDVEKESIKKVIQTSYIDGLHNRVSVVYFQNGFHPGFNLLGVKDNMLTKYPIYSWIESFKKKKAKDPNPKIEEEKTTCDYLLIDVTGNAAIAKIQLNRKGKLVFTDYLQLYKFEEGWKIVSKTYFRH